MWMRIRKPQPCNVDPSARLLELSKKHQDPYVFTTLVVVRDNKLDLALGSMPKTNLVDILRATRYGVRYERDVVATGLDDYWQSSVETLEMMTGDCEDKAILAVAMLRSRGASPVEALVAIGETRSTTGPSGHAWIVVRDGGPWQSYDATYSTWKSWGKMVGFIGSSVTVVLLWFPFPWWIPSILIVPWIGSFLGRSMGALLERLGIRDVNWVVKESLFFNDTYLLGKGTTRLEFVGWFREGDGVTDIRAGDKPVAHLRVANQGEFAVRTWVRLETRDGKVSRQTDIDLGPGKDADIELEFEGLQPGVALFRSECGMDRGPEISALTVRP